MFIGGVTKRNGGWQHFIAINIEKKSHRQDIQRKQEEKEKSKLPFDGLVYWHKQL